MVVFSLSSWSCEMDSVSLGVEKRRRLVGIRGLG